jgi:protein-tyrosine phosphatase
MDFDPRREIIGKASKMGMKKVLFLCTGNYYRSRFAEGLFNHLADQQRLGWRAESRGLAIGRNGIVNVGPIAPDTLEAFQQRSIPVPEDIRYPTTATLPDFASADLVIALKEAEHRTLIQQHFPDWTERVTYWHVHDLDQAPARSAIPEMETLVRALIARLCKAAEIEGLDTDEQRVMKAPLPPAPPSE